MTVFIMEWRRELSWWRLMPKSTSFRYVTLTQECKKISDINLNAYLRRQMCALYGKDVSFRSNILGSGGVSQTDEG